MESITITITAQTLNAIGAGLNELPYKVAAPAIKEIEEQVNAYLKEKQRGTLGQTGENSATGGSDGTGTQPGQSNSGEASVIGHSTSET